MKIGLVYPQTEFGSDPAAIRDYAQTAEGLGFTHIMAYDHILGANPEGRGGPWRGPYTYEDAFQEVFVLFSFMAGATSAIEFLTGILIGPQRETALVAKQAATLDVLSAGRLRLGVGIGWNKVEYVAMSQDFHTRGKRLDEQLEVLHELWTKPLVTYQGRWHDIPDAGLNPMPVQQPIPIWFGGHADAVLQRVARWGEGWIPGFGRVAQARGYLDKLAGFVAAAGRSPADIGLDIRIRYGGGDADLWAEIMAEWRAAGATHLTLNTMGAGLQGPGEHLAAVRRFAAAVGL